ncbi:MAG: EamA family transporter [Robiginitomaculum sp.]
MTSSSSPDHNAHYRNWGYGFAFIGTLLFAMKAILVKLAFTSPDGEAFILEPATLLFLRMAFAVPVYLLIGVWLLRARRAKGLAASSRAILLKSMAVGCLAYYVCSLLDFTGLTYITAQLERLLLYTYPVFVFILGALFLGSG